MTVIECNWTAPCKGFTISDREVHIWRGNLNLPACRIQQLSQSLSPEEKEKADRFCFENDRVYFIACRGLLRLVLGYYLKKDPIDLRFLYSSRGKPALDSSSLDGRLSFNISHSNGLALFAVAYNRSVGIDLEMTRPLSDIDQLAEFFFSHREYSVLSCLPPEQKIATFFNSWTLKEAYLKATGEGLEELRKVEVIFTSRGSEGILSIQADTHANNFWSAYVLNLQPGYASALVIEETNLPVCIGNNGVSRKGDNMLRKDRIRFFKVSHLLDL